MMDNTNSDNHTLPSPCDHPTNSHKDVTATDILPSKTELLKGDAATGVGGLGETKESTFKALNLPPLRLANSPQNLAIQYSPDLLDTLYQSRIAGHVFKKAGYLTSWARRLLWMEPRGSWVDCDQGDDGLASTAEGGRPGVFGPLSQPPSPPSPQSATPPSTTAAAPPITVSQPVSIQHSHSPNEDDDDEEDHLSIRPSTSYTLPSHLQAPPPSSLSAAGTRRLSSSTLYFDSVEPASNNGGKSSATTTNPTADVEHHQLTNNNTTTIDQQSSIDTFTLATYNVWFDALHQPQRAQALLDTILPPPPKNNNNNNTIENDGGAHLPDVICLQEVTRPFLAVLSKHEQVRKHYWVSDVTGETCTSRLWYGVLIMVKRTRWEVHGCVTIECPSDMGRNLLMVEISLPSSSSPSTTTSTSTTTTPAHPRKRIRVATCHFESLGSRNKRDIQRRLAKDLLLKTTDVLFGSNAAHFGAGKPKKSSSRSGSWTHLVRRASETSMNVLPILQRTLSDPSVITMNLDPEVYVPDGEEEEKVPEVGAWFLAGDFNIIYDDEESAPTLEPLSFLDAFNDVSGAVKNHHPKFPDGATNGVLWPQNKYVPRRLDRVVYLPSHHVVGCQELEYVGWTAIKGLHGRLGPKDPVFPSDHLGVVSKFNLREI